MKLNGDADEALMAQYGVRAFPTLLSFYRGVVIQSRVGFGLADYPALRSWIANCLAEATGIAVPMGQAEPAFEQAVAGALAAHDAVLGPLLQAAIAAQEPFLPAHTAASAHIKAMFAAGEIDKPEALRREAELASRLHTAVEKPMRLLSEANLIAGPALDEAIVRATTAFLATVR